jgi:hypothetical protein
MFNAISLRDNEEFFQSLKSIKDIDAVQQILRLYFQDIENCLAKASGRIPADVVIYSTPDEQGRTNPYYNYIKNELKIFYPNNSKPIEYLMSLYHESAHADQNLSPSKSVEQETLYKISKSLYVSPKHSKKRLHLGYRCNYKELEAKLRETNFLIEAYKKVKERDKVLSPEKGRYYRNVFISAKKNIENRMPHDIRKLMLFNLVCVSLDAHRKAPVADMEQSEILSFLLRKAPKLYKEISKQLLEAYREIKKIEKELDIYSPEKMPKKSEEIGDNRLKELKELCKHPKVKKILKAQGKTTMYEAKDYQECADKLKKILPDPNVLEVFVMPSTYGDNCAVLYVEKERSIADEIFEDDFMKEDFLVDIKPNDRFGLGGDER